MVKKASQPGLHIDTRAKRHMTQRTHGMNENSQVSTKWLLMTVHTHTNTHTHIEAHTHTLVDTTHEAAAHIQETHNKHENTYTHTQTQTHYTYNTHTQSSPTAENATATDCKTHTGHLVESLGQYN